MKNYTINFKQYNMLCGRCLMNVAKCLSNLHGIECFEISLKSKKITVVYKNKIVSRKMIQNMVNETILTGKVKNVYSFSA